MKEQSAEFKSISHWAEDLVVGDRCYGTIRHKTDGEKNIHNTLLVVIENHPEKMFVKALLDDYAGNGLIKVPYNELTKQP